MKSSFPYNGGLCLLRAYELIFLILKQGGLIDLETRRAGDFEGEVVTSASGTEPTAVLTPEELHSLEKVWKELGHYSSWRLSEKSHSELAWQQLPNGKLIPYSYAESLSL